ncbi:MAG: transposase, partial [Erysipelotrichaceae bacterium]
IIAINKRRWQIEECFRIMKTDFEARPIYLQREDRIKAHFLVCFLSLLIYRLLESKLENRYTAEQTLSTLRYMNVCSVEGYGYIPTYNRTDLTDDLHNLFDFRTDTQIIKKSKMRNIIQKTKER